LHEKSCLVDGKKLFGGGGAQDRAARVIDGQMRARDQVRGQRSALCSFENRDVRIALPRCIISVGNGQCGGQR
jgi:hypothetical protein